MEHVITQVSVKQVPDQNKQLIPCQTFRCTCGHEFEMIGDINHTLADGTLKYPNRIDMPTEYKCPKDVKE